MLNRAPLRGLLKHRLHIRGVCNPSAALLQDFRSSRERRLLPETLKGKVNNLQILLNEDVAKAVNNNIVSLHLPNNLRRVAKNQFLKLQENEVYELPKTSLEVDAHIAGFFLRDYAAAFQVLTELKSRLGKSNFNPQRVLDVSLGPATGMIALNDVMGAEFRPEEKDAVITSGSEMTKRAKIMLSRQFNEIPIPPAEAEIPDTQDKTIDSGGPEVNEDYELVGEVMTKKIKTVTKLKNTVPVNKKYDLIILHHQLLRNRKKFPKQVDENIETYLKHLAPNGHIVVIERGTPLGFETIARARQLMIRPERHPMEHGKISRPWLRGAKMNITEGPGDFYLSIVAPCPHHRQCPLQTGNPNFYNLPQGKKLKFCSFQKSIRRPKFSIELKKGKWLAMPWEDDNDVRKHRELRGKGRPHGKNEETVSFSYLIAKRSPTDPETLQQIEKTRESSTTKYETGSLGDNTQDTWPRILTPPSKQKGHVVFDLCAPSGQLEKWIVPKSFSKEAYHDARKATKGDLWALDAKTKIQSLGRINLEKFEKLEKERVRAIKKEDKERGNKMGDKLKKLDQSEAQTNIEEMIDESAEAYGYFWKQDQ
ncbi:tRNA methyltransferase RSM22 KNAG_0F03290 [Huiozyma naganishii CBS 8797]|uniref:Uncharacterized protein n=1 Tax=Huiozyma naganishii (strain ATCC MYA-139 / BCRC 22969 / CBS 8797 / KCTC 17520 / NBRC 10181 / NCYC 3082 / Yp74L-3) TaxID=1071383 RepID=J7S8N5_HUIN7|nr:hypothetical protein KNAG_0F03290 [Kazachstania naganishii CBS 8797]CCK70991.1 hypothetical protein KNAG_0F03290 [Kazachstania naganishii CBS 8797]